MTARHENNPAETIKSVLETLLVRRFRESLYKQIGSGLPVTIRDGTYPVLVGLRKGPKTATELAQQVGVDRSVVSRHASELCTAGLVMREQDTRDRRGGLLGLTESGRTIADGLDAAALNLVSTATRNLTESELNAFAEQFTAFVSSLTETHRQ